MTGKGGSGDGPSGELSVDVSLEAGGRSSRRESNAYLDLLAQELKRVSSEAVGDAGKWLKGKGQQEVEKANEIRARIIEKYHKMMIEADAQEHRQAIEERRQSIEDIRAAVELGPQVLDLIEKLQERGVTLSVDVVLRRLLPPPDEAMRSV